MKIVALSDTHFATHPGLPERRGEIADVLLQRAVQRIHRLIRPDVVVLLGDMVDNGGTAEAGPALAKLRKITDRLTCPVIAIPGNHDGDAKDFYQAFPRPADTVDLDGVRFLPFLDPELPHWNALRTPEDLARMATARDGHDGPIVTLQHCALFPPHTSNSPYNYRNIEEIIARMQRQGITLSISGHYHAGVDHIRQGPCNFVIVPALCESPFAFLEIDLEGSEVRVTRHALRMPPELHLVDYHTHTPFAYCGEDVACASTVQWASDFGLAGVCFTEHSGQLYFDRETYGSGTFLHDGIDHPGGRQERMAQYLETARRYSPPATLALEVDCDYSGHPVVRVEDSAQVSILVGAIHDLAGLPGAERDLERLMDEYLASLSQFLRSGIHILAHPFRVFRRAGLPVPERLFTPTMQLLKKHGVAAEINFHTNEPPEAFYRLCLAHGVKLTFGSDAHARYEIGDFALHLDLLRRCGYDGDVRDVLANLLPAGDRGVG